MSIKKELPEGWKRLKLSEVCHQIIGGGTPSTKIDKYWVGTIPWITSADIHGLKEISPRKMVTKEAIENSTASILPKGGIIVVTRVSLGRIAIAPYDVSFSQDNQGLILNEDLIDKSFALIFLSVAVLLFKHNSRGTTIKGVTKKQLTDLEVLLPPLLEQQQIVDKIEELFSELDKGIENLNTAQQQLKVYRQAVLKWAFEGKLTNENVEDGELPKGWEWVKITDLAASTKNSLKAGPFGSSLKKEFYVTKGYKVYGQEQVIKDDPFYGNYYVNADKYQELNTNKIQSGDVLISLVGTVGKVLVLPKNCEEGIINPRLIKITLNRKRYNPVFFKYYFESSTVKAYYSTKAQGTTMDVLNLGIIKTIPFPMCDISQQDKIIQEIESRLSVCDNIEEAINSSLQQAEALRQSILKKAFEGKLTKHDIL